MSHEATLNCSLINLQPAGCDAGFPGDTLRKRERLWGGGFNPRGQRAAAWVRKRRRRRWRRKKRPVAMAAVNPPLFNSETRDDVRERERERGKSKTSPPPPPLVLFLSSKSKERV